MGHEVIDAVKAARLISDYIHHVKKTDASKNITLGGLLNAEDLRLLCKDSHPPKLSFFPELPNPTTEHFHVMVDSGNRDNGVFPIEVFSAPALHSDIDMLSFLHRQKRIKEDTVNFNLTANKDSHDNFQKWMLKMDLGVNGTFELSSSKKENLIQSLLEINKTEVLHVRYFLGLRKTTHPNVTLILCPVDITGRNILVLPDGSAAGWISLF
jgi:hypothetical protein